MKWIQRKLKALFYVAKHSVTDPAYYRSLSKTSFSFSFKYLWGLMFFIVVISMVIPVAGFITLMPQLPQFVDDLRGAARDLYPQELILTLENGVLSTNVEEPYYIDVPSQFADIDTGDIRHLVTIDTQANVEDFPSYDTVFLLTDTGFVVPDQEQDRANAYRVYSFEEQLESMSDETVVIDRQLYDSFLGQAMPYFNYIVPGTVVIVLLLVIILPFTLTSILLITRLIYLIFVSAFLWVIARLLKKHYTYGEVYRMGMHMITVPILIGTVMGLIGLNLSLLWSFLLLLAFGGYILSAMPDAKKSGKK